MAKVPPPKGTRDFYPDIMARRNWILDRWKEVSIRNGFVEYDGPIFERLELYTQKSGEGIVSELFSLTDRGGRDLAIRPEMTPSLARMVNQKINALPRPIKWFSMPRCCRAERPQKGRLREFFQWNVDIVGMDSVLADAESIYTAIDCLRYMGLRGNDIVAKISCRAMLAAILLDIGFAEEDLDKLYILLDKRPKVSSEAFGEMVAEAVPDEALREKMLAVGAIDSLDKAREFASSQAAIDAVDNLCELFNILEKMGVGTFCKFDITIVRGLAYYTGPVFEIFDRKDSLRAVCGGGRYDNLLAGLGGQKVSGTGFGMGDVVLEILLDNCDLIDAQPMKLDYFIIDADKELFDKVLDITSQLRNRGFASSFSYKRAAIGKQFKQAGNLNAKYAVIVGGETLEDGSVTVKDMKTGTQEIMSIDQLLKRDC